MLVNQYLQAFKNEKRALYGSQWEDNLSGCSRTHSRDNEMRKLGIGAAVGVAYMFAAFMLKYGSAVLGSTAQGKKGSK